MSKRSLDFYAKRNLHRAKKDRQWDGRMIFCPSGPSPLKRVRRIRTVLTEFDSDTGVWKRRYEISSKV